MGKKVESMIRSVIRGNDDVEGKSSAIAILKSQGLIKQSGGGLALTKKGRKAKVGD